MQAPSETPSSLQTARSIPLPKVPATLGEPCAAAPQGLPSLPLWNNLSIKLSTEGIIRSSCWRKRTLPISFSLADATERGFYIYTYIYIYNPPKTSHLNLGYKRYLPCERPRTSTGIEREDFNKTQKQGRPEGEPAAPQGSQLPNCHFARRLNRRPE